MLKTDFKNPWLLLASALLLVAMALFWQYFAVFNFKGLNSDHAIHLLMAENLRLPQGFYFLGQNRLGSLIPMLSFLGVQLGLSAIVATTITQIIILGTTLLLAAQLLPSKRLALWFSPVVFLPVYPFTMQVMVGHPYLAQHFFSLLFFYLYYKKVGQGSALWAWLFTLVGFLALWSSELAIAAIAGLILVENKRIFTLLKGNWLPASLGAVLGLCFLLMVKNNARKSDRYQQPFTSPSEAWLTIKGLADDFGQMLLCNTNKPFNTVLIYVILGLLIYLVVAIARNNKRLSRLSYVFLITAILSMLAVFASNWGVRMGRPLRYYIPAYFFFMLFLVSALSHTRPAKKWQLHLPLSLLGLVAGYSSYVYVSTFSLKVNGRMLPKTAKSIYQQVRPLVPAQNFAIMGTFWNTHLIDALHPDVVGVPFELYQLRDRAFLKEALQYEYFVMVGNEWLEELPPEIENYHHRFVKQSPTFSKQDIYYAVYRKVE